MMDRTTAEPGISVAETLRRKRKITISFSRSMTSKDRSGRTRTTMFPGIRSLSFSNDTRRNIIFRSGLVNSPSLRKGVVTPTTRRSLPPSGSNLLPIPMRRTARAVRWPEAAPPAIQEEACGYHQQSERYSCPVDAISPG